MRARVSVSARRERERQSLRTRTSAFAFADEDIRIYIPPAYHRIARESTDDAYRTRFERLHGARLYTSR